MLFQGDSGPPGPVGLPGTEELGDKQSSFYSSQKDDLHTIEVRLFVCPLLATHMCTSLVCGTLEGHSASTHLFATRQVTLIIYRVCAGSSQLQL